jgi:hypothetical protein
VRSFGDVPLTRAEFRQILNPEAVALAKRLHRYQVDKRRRSLRDIAAELETAGHITGAGKRHAATAISKMIAA